MKNTAIFGQPVKLFPFIVFNYTSFASRLTSSITRFPAKDWHPYSKSPIFRPEIIRFFTKPFQQYVSSTATIIIGSFCFYPVFFKRTRNSPARIWQKTS
jgi:hypothetical protein